MLRFLHGTLILLGGVFLGWLLRGQWFQGEVVEPAAVLTQPPRAAVDSAPGAMAGSAVGDMPLLKPVGKPDKGDFPARFRDLLESRHFDQAVELYAEAQALGGDHRALLRPVLESYLKTCLERCAEGVFNAAVDAWLSSYYDDIPVLLLLAEYQLQQGYPEEAALVMQLAMTYAYQPTQRDHVALALRRLVKSTDEFYRGRQRWIELLGFYELLQEISLGEPTFSLRQAMIYRQLGEPERARELLLALQAGDDGLNPQWTNSIELQLARVSTDPEPQPIPANAVPLVRQGDHYLVSTTLNNRQQVVLVIDTGASVTSLSRASFDRLGGTDFSRLGSRLFNTANGMVRGEVYRADSIGLGNTRLEDIQVAVLEYQSPDGVDGLLGMNVLRNYRFEIDQDLELLYLRPR